MDAISFMSKVRCKIKNLNVFKQVCKKHSVGVKDGQGQYQGQDIALDLTDELFNGQNTNPTMVVKDAKEQGAHNLVVDNDQSYSSLSKRLGVNGGILMRDYVEEMFNNELTQQGAMITSRQEQKDKSIVLRVSIPR